jgi:hypothetical protein
MAELSGSLDSFGIAPILRLMTDLHKSGRVRISQASPEGPGWTAELLVENGQTVAAFFGAARGLGAAPSRALSGLAALDAIVLALGNAAFFFVEGTPSPERNVVLSASELQARLALLEEERLTSGTALPPLGAVPRRVQLDEEHDAGQEIVIDRGKLHLLLAVDGHRTIAELIGDQELLRTFRDLTWLARNGFVQFVEQDEDIAAASGPLHARQQT